jgi:uncharacterized protein YlxW (UPF0749 family)
VTGGRRSTSRRPTVAHARWAITVGLALAVVGFVGAGQWNSSLERERFASSIQHALADQVVALERDNQTFRDQLEEVEAEVREHEERSAGSEVVHRDLARDLAAARLASGLTPVRGPGVIVEVADSQRVVPPGENPASFIVLADDLRDIVTALWASGAEAMTINQERLVATTSIYGVGNSILVNSAFLQPPFQVQAIGADGLLARFLENEAFLGRVSQRISVYGLEFATASVDELELPAFVGSTRFRWGVPLTEEP